MLVRLFRRLSLDTIHVFTRSFGRLVVTFKPIKSVAKPFYALVFEKSWVGTELKNTIRFHT